MAEKEGQKNKGMERPPIIAVMGHIDHGKSTLLDYIRKTNVVDTESGGITQHVSAYEVVHTNKEGAEKKITFLDTPGHEAFKAMRASGTHIADIAILVVAADDSIKAQTLEAYNQIKAAGIPFVVAINKIDKEGANPDKVRNELIENNIYLEGLGGDIPFVDISATKGTGMPDLLEMLALVADMEELTGNPEDAATGFVLESEIDSRKGISATLVITNGTLKKAEFVVAGEAMSPVRSIETFLGEQVESASFSEPVRITGFDKPPEAGVSFSTFQTKKQAEQARDSGGGSPSVHTIIGDKDARVVIPIIIKTDTQGTLEAVLQEMKKVATDSVSLKIIHADVGDITENDIKTAAGATEPIVIGFRVQPDAEAVKFAEQQQIKTHTFAIIYNITDFLEEEVKKRTPVEEKEQETGKVKVLKTFSTDKNKQLVGGKVLEGFIEKGARVHIFRRESEIGKGVLRELQQQKAPASKVNEGSECGMIIEARADIAAGDIIVPFVVVRE